MKKSSEPGSENSDDYLDDSEVKASETFVPENIKSKYFQNSELTFLTILQSYNLTDSCPDSKLISVSNIQAAKHRRGGEHSKAHHLKYHSKSNNKSSQAHRLVINLDDKNRFTEEVTV